MNEQVVPGRQPAARENWKARFFTIWTGQQLSSIGSRLGRFALVWWITATTGSATVLAMATLVALLPEVLLAPFVGAYVDRHNRRRIMILADGFVALASAVLAYLFWSGQMQVWHVYVIMLARSLGETLHWPAMQASTSLMVPERHLARVAGMNSTMMGVLSVVAPPLGALLLELLPLHGIMAIDVITALLAIVPLLFVGIPQPAPRPAASGGATSLWAGVREGLTYVRAWPGLFRIMLMAALLNFMLAPAGTLQPILVTKHFGGGALQLGWSNSAWGAGVILGGLVLSLWGGFRRRVITSLAGLVGLGLGAGMVGLASAHLFAVGLAGLFVMGFMNPIVNGPLMATVQAKVAPEMQGRVFTIMQALAGAMMPLSMAIAGPVADALGVQVWFLIGGLTCIAMGIGALFVPSIMNLEAHAGPAAAEAAAD